VRIAQKEKSKGWRSVQDASPDSTGAGLLAADTNNRLAFIPAPIKTQTAGGTASRWCF